MTKIRLWLGCVLLLLAACGPRRWGFSNITQHHVVEGRLAGPTQGEPVRSEAFLDLYLRKLCVGRFPDGFSHGTEVLVGVKLSGFDALDDAAKQWRPQEVKRTLTAVGAVDRACINFQSFPLGHYRYAGSAFTVEATLRRIASDEERTIAKTILEGGRDVLGALPPAYAAIGLVALPVHNLLYRATVEPHLDSVDVVTYPLTFEAKDSNGSALVVRQGMTILLGEMSEKNPRWLAPNLPRKPTTAETEKLKVLPTGELVTAEGTPWTEAPYLSLAANVLHRNPAVRETLTQYERQALVDGLAEGPGAGDAPVALDRLSKKLRDLAHAFGPEEAQYISQLRRCTEGWLTFRSASAGSVLTTGDISNPEELLRAAGQIAQACRDFSSAVQQTGATTCDALERTAGLLVVPYCDEWQLQRRSDALLTLLRRRAKGESDTQLARQTIDKLSTEKFVLEATVTQKKLDQAKTVEMLAKAGFDPANLEQSLVAYRRVEAEAQELRGVFAMLSAGLSQLTDFGVQVSIRRNQIVIQLPGDVLFASGSYQLKPSAKAPLLKIAEVVRTNDRLSSKHFQVAGHTDNIPVKTSEVIRDNWDLSYRRARVVLDLLTRDAPDGGGLPPKRIGAAGFAELDPIAPNDTEEGRAKNRRVELVLLPELDRILDLEKAIRPAQQR